MALDCDKPKGERGKEVWLVGCLLLGSLAIRILYIHQLRSYPGFEILPPGLNPHSYDWFAQRVAQGDLLRGLPFPFPPLYVYFLAFLYKVFGHNLLLPLILQALTGVLSLFLCYLIAKRSFSRMEGYLVLGFGSLYGTLIFFGGMLVPVSLAIPLILGSLLLLLVAKENPSLGKFVGAGSLLALSALARGFTLIFFPLALGWIAVSFRRERRKPLLYPLSFCLGLLLILSPVVLRNHWVGGDTVLISSDWGVNFFIGNSPHAQGAFQAPPFMDDSQMGLLKDSQRLAEISLGRELRPSEASRYWFAQGITFMKSHPGAYLRLLLRKFLLSWQGHEPCNITDYYFFRSRFFSVLNFPLASFGVIAPLAFLGIVLSARRWRSLSILYLYMGSVLLSLMIFFVTARYRLMMVPVLLLFSSHSVCWFFQRVKRRQVKALLLFGGAALVLFGAVNLGSSQARASLAVSHCNLGSLYFRRGSLGKAKSEYQRAIEYAPDYFKSHYNLGCLYLQMGLYGKAVGCFRTAIGLNPFYQDGYNNLGSAYFRRGEYSQAMVYYKKAIELDPEDAGAIHNLAGTYLILGRYAEAVPLFQRALSLDPKLTAAKSALSRCRAELKRGGVR